MVDSGNLERTIQGACSAQAEDVAAEGGNEVSDAKARVS